MVDLVWFALVAGLVFAILIIFQNTLTSIMVIEKNVDILVELDDKGSKLNCLLRTRTTDMDAMDILVSDIAGMVQENEYLDYLADETETTLWVYKKGGEDAASKVYGESLRSGHEFSIDVPLPGGGTGKVGVVLCMELPEGETWV